MKSPQFYIETFRNFLSQGMSHAEAMEQFDSDEWNKAMVNDLALTSRRIGDEEMKWTQDDTDKSRTEADLYWDAVHRITHDPRVAHFFGNAAAIQGPEVSLGQHWDYEHPEPQV